jgi:hypothetical protein
MNSDALTEFLKLAVPPTVGALIAAGIKGTMTLASARRKRRASQPGSGLVLRGGVSTTPRETARPSRPARRGRLRQGVDLVWKQIYGLPPLKRRASTWKATLVGGLLVGFGVAGYFRTRVDALVGIALTIPFFIAVPFLPQGSDSPAESSNSGGPYWAYVLAYSSMGLTGLYSYLRATSSNRRLEGDGRSTVGPASEAERTKVLDREIKLLTANGWRLESASEFEAVLSRNKCPNHLLHLFLTLLTLCLWAIVWIAQTKASRRKRELEYRRISVDAWANWTVEALPGAGGLA